FLNKIMLGSMSSVVEAGFFDSSDKIIRMCLTLITALTTVMMPRVANLFANGDNKKVNEYLKIGFGIAIMFAFPIFFGIEGVASGFVPWFFGEKFVDVIPVISVEAFAIIPIAFSQILGIQYLVPIGKTNQYSKAIILGAVVNLIANIPLIYLYSAVGTAVATVVSETCITILELFYVSKSIKISTLFKESWKPILSSFIMYLGVKFLNSFLRVSFLNLVVEVFIGITVYTLILLVLKYTIFIEFSRKLLKNRQR
ncbi:polysaccharide biosynthesis C-terminal domain-containing protein, partial [Liquorilactobacillus ghanensis]|uniref:lipid II flippase MurJ n=1 Tax=Liquorilactobacillus ghanensis TaxID=399370 RepID=UPI0039EA6F16